jgi:FMN phosphatase YigB (HAD superfamily)
MINTVLCDLDGTLLPLEPQRFLQAYFRALTAKIVPLGYDEDQLMQAIWQGTAAQQRNSGEKTNHQLFWDIFTSLLGERAAILEDVLLSFYQNEFAALGGELSITADRRPMIDNLKGRGYTLALASNPVFPLAALESRLAWTGLNLADFSYISHYENSHFCKPDLRYYEEICRNLGKDPSQCLMIGNNCRQDGCFRELGGQVYLATDQLEEAEGFDLDSCSHGPLDQLDCFLDSLQD